MNLEGSAMDNPTCGLVAARQCLFGNLNVLGQASISWHRLDLRVPEYEAPI
ncbi:predicted protein [Plenodomus lingam JN3]|uniref:Uncharacterized protein n=1 Tax=Leptosphaeria maculans (strain JN3 / isolate v23.1.3 / race Av1-4-5-6-7-8) TaxID=985895 RepID=E4ZGR6_LEPMJ|nr:predicted protein [Plenodomus lingam JN3]CBX90486.1 predicted protein [Plenodomus lingam JN3]